MPGHKITFKTKIASKTFGSAMIHFDFERTAYTIDVDRGGKGAMSPPNILKI